MRALALAALFLALPALAQDEPSATSASKHAKKKKKVKTRHVKRHRAPEVPESIAPPVKRERHKRVPVEVDVEEAPAAAEEQPPAESGDEAPADEAESEGGSAVDFEAQGYVRARGTHAFTDEHALLSGVVAPTPENLFSAEVNVQPKLRLFDGHLMLAADLSLLGTTQAPYVSVLLSELYVQATFFDTVYVLAGRRRVVWGTGLSWNPTDVVNPPRDLLEPARTRAGSLMLPMIDAAFSAVTLSGFVSLPMAYDAYGLPKSVSLNPVVGARAFTSQLGVDLSLMYFYDHGKQRHSAGAAVSSVLFDSYEVHAEGVVHVGSVDRPPMERVDACGPGLGDAPKLGGALVAGVRRDWSDRSLVGIEYLFNSGGYTPEEYQLVRTELPCLRAAAKVAQLRDPTRTATLTSPVVLVRQHYVSLLAQKPHLADEGLLEHIGVSGGAIVSLADGSSILQARLDASIGSGLVLSLVGAAFLGLDGGEVALAPTRGLVSFDVQWSY